MWFLAPASSLLEATGPGGQTGKSLAQVPKLLEGRGKARGQHQSYRSYQVARFPPEICVFLVKVLLHRAEK